MIHTRWHKMVDELRLLADAPDAEITLVNQGFDENGALAVTVTQKYARLFLTGDTPQNIDVNNIPVFVMSKVRENDHSVYFCTDTSDMEFVTLTQNVRDLPWPFRTFVLELQRENNTSAFIVVRVMNDNKFHFAMIQHRVDFVLLQSASILPVDGITSAHKSIMINPGWSKIIGDVATVENEIVATLGGLRYFMVQCATKGIVQERIEAPKFLNKQRVRKGKTPVPDTIFMRPGHYYDRSGERHEYDARNPVRMHWRRGHIRNVWCGTGDERHQETRYIAPCLVNYDGGDTPQHKVRVLH